MKISDILSMSFRNLWRRKVRTILTIFGVLIGSCAIVIMISLGIGVNQSLEYQLSQMGDLNIITIYSSNGGYYAVSEKSIVSNNEPAPLDMETVTFIESIDGVTAVMPKLQIDSNMVTLNAGKGNRYATQFIQIYGVNTENLEKFNYKLKNGEFPDNTNTDFIIFGSQAAYNFIDTKKKTNNSVWAQPMPDGSMQKPFFDPMTESSITIFSNQDDKMDNNGYIHLSPGSKYEHRLKVAGVFEEDWNKYETIDSIFINMSLAEKLMNDYNKLNHIKEVKNQGFSEILVYVEDINKISDIQVELDSIGLQYSSMDQIRESFQSQVIQAEMLLGGLAAISLFVAAIGITNTMIMSIYERTREIGIMKVLGCHIRNIREVFLIEAGCIGFTGGAVGIILSYIFSFFINKFLSGAIGGGIMDASGKLLPISVIPIWLILLALVFSTLIGLISGLYPANRAMKISALEAIKNE